MIDLCRIEIVDQLNFMFLCHVAYCFELHYDSILNYEIRGKLSHNMLAVVNSNRFLLLDFESKLLQFDTQSIFIDLFKKTRPKTIMVLWTLYAHPIIFSVRLSISISQHLL